MAARSTVGPNVLAKVKQRRSKRPRKKRTLPEPRQYTITDLDRAQDRVEAAERRVNSDTVTGTIVERDWNALGANCTSSSRTFARAALSNNTHPPSSASPGNSRRLAPHRWLGTYMHAIAQPRA